MLFVCVYSVSFLIISPLSWLRRKQLFIANLQSACSQHLTHKTPGHVGGGLNTAGYRRFEPHSGLQVSKYVSSPLTQYNCVHKGGLNPHAFHIIFLTTPTRTQIQNKLVWLLSRSQQFCMGNPHSSRQRYNEFRGYSRPVIAYIFAFAIAVALIRFA